MGKSIAKNAAFNMLHNAVAVIFPLVTTTYISRVLGASGVGEVSSAQNLVLYFTLIATLGIPYYGVRAISQCRSDKKKCDKTFSELFAINFLSTMFALLCYIICIFLIDGGLFNNSLHLIFSSLIIMSVFNIEWMYKGFEEYRYITIRGIIVKLVSLVLMFVFVKNDGDLYFYAAIICFGSVGNYILNMLKMRKYVKLHLKGLNLKCHMKAIMIFFASVVAIEIYTLLDVTMITYMCSPDNVGYYTNASKIVKIIANTITAIGAVLLPKLSIYFKQQNETVIKKLVNDFFDVITMFTIPCCIGIFITASEIVPVLFGDDFLPSITTMRVLCPLVLFLTLSGGIFSQILQSSGREKMFFFSVCGGALVNIILNAILINLWQQNGAALASVITEIIVNILMLFFCQKVIKIRYFSKNFLKSLLSSVLMIVFIFVARGCTYNLSSLIILLSEIALGVIGYILGLVISKHGMLVLVLNKFKRKKQNEK